MCSCIAYEDRTPAQGYPRVHFVQKSSLGGGAFLGKGGVGLLSVISTVKWKAGQNRQNIIHVP